MSLEQFARVWGTSPATGTTLLVHLAIADLAIEKMVRAAQAAIADLARCSVTTVARAMQELVDLGVIIVVDDRTKPAIYALIHQSDGISTQLRMNRVDNVQNDGILQADGKEPQESGQTEGIAVQDTLEVNSARDVRLPNEGNIGAPMPVSTEDIAEIPLREPTPPVVEVPSVADMRPIMDLQDAIARDVREATGIDRVLIEDPAPAPTFKAMARSVVLQPSSDPVAELSAFLRALGVQPNPEAPAYWYRDEHVQDFKALLLFADKTPGELLDAVHQAQVKTPTIRKLADAYNALAQAGIIPF